ncbi:MAG: HNH endonuclease signature motif containing protein [Nocardioidaceae bacterium]
MLLAQDFQCATPGCHHRNLQIHHIVSWLAGGPTDMTNLIGLCTSCHTLLHRGHLVCTADGHGGAVFHTAGGILIPDTRRRTMSQFERGLDGQRRERTQEGRDCTDVA